MKRNEAQSARAESMHKGVNYHSKDITKAQQQLTPLYVPSVTDKATDTDDDDDQFYSIHYGHEANMYTFRMETPSNIVKTTDTCIFRRETTDTRSPQKRQKHEHLLDGETLLTLTQWVAHVRQGPSGGGGWGVFLFIPLVIPRLLYTQVELHLQHIMKQLSAGHRLVQAPKP